jgi:hypothetical protein
MPKLLAILMLFLLPVLSGLTACTTAYRKSIAGDLSNVVHRTYLADFDTTWQACLEALKNARLDIINREAGYLQTRWIDNTEEKNFIDSFGETNAYLKAQYRTRISLAKGQYKKQQTIKVTIWKEQMFQKDALDGWRSAATDPYDEMTLLYRIGQIIRIRHQLKKLEDDKVKQYLESTHQ